MRYLIDTHVALWVLKGEPISDKAKEILDDVTANVFVRLGLSRGQMMFFL